MIWLSEKEVDVGKPGRATQGKRDRERAQKERKEQKIEQRAIRKDARGMRMESLKDGVDPDLIGIYPGPQPTLDHD